MLLSLVVPCYNEEGNVDRFFSEVKSAFSGRNEKLEFVFVDDGSKDSTLSRLRAIYNENPADSVQVLSFSRNFGKEAAMYAGLTHAQGDMVCIIDADLQQRPEVVIEMLDIIEKNDELDCVTAYQDSRHESKFISASKSFFYNFINKISDVEFRNGASDFRLMRRNMVEAILSMKEYHRFSKGIFSYVGFDTEYIPYTAADRESGESKWGFKKLVKYALEGIMAFSTAPLRFPLWASIAAFVGAIICAVFSLSAGGEVFSDGWQFAVLLILGGAILLSLGILGAYLSKMYIEAKNRPVYILKTHLRREENGKN